MSYLLSVIIINCGPVKPTHYKTTAPHWFIFKCYCMNLMNHTRSDQTCSPVSDNSPTLCLFLRGSSNQYFYSSGLRKTPGIKSYFITSWTRPINTCCLSIAVQMTASRRCEGTPVQRCRVHDVSMESKLLMGGN